MVARLLAMVSLLAYSGMAFSQVSANLHACPEDAGGVNSCTANEINIANTTEVFTDALECPSGGQVQITNIIAIYGLNTGVRYDPLLWIGQTGIDPRESGGSCFVTSAPEFAPELELFQDLDGDSCLDITDPAAYDTVPDPVELDYDDLNFMVDCQDADEDGIADVHVVVTWLQNTSLQCGSGPGQSFAPGAPSKCDYNLISLGIPYLPPKPKLTIIKNVLNNNGGTAVSSDWTMDITGANPSQNNFPGAPAPGVTVTIDADTAYSVDESGGPGGYSKSLSAGCSGMLASGETATCIITNDDIAPELTVIKHVDDTLGGTAVASDWDMLITALNPSDNNFPGSEAGVTITINANAPYSVDESDLPSGYIKSFEGDCSGTLLPGDEVTCTITNTFPGNKPMLTVIKEVVNDDGGTAVSPEWTMNVTAINPSSNNFPGAPDPGVTISIDPGAYSVLESGGPDGYTPMYDAGCAGVLAVNQSATCIITNDDEPAELTVIKHVVNTGGGTAVASDWTMNISGPVNPSNNNFPGSEAGVMVTINSNAAYSVDESGGPDGYIKTLGPDCSGVLLPGGEATCTITNTYDPNAPILTLRKNVINDNGGDAVDTDWTLFADGPSPIEGVEGSNTVTEAMVSAGAYTLSEDFGPDGYELTGWSCTGGSFDEETFILTLALDDVAICTVSNDDIAPELTITKHVVNIGGGTAVAANWNMLVNPGANPSQNNFPGSEAGVTITIDANTPYGVDESPGPDNYIKSIGPGCSGTLGPGDTADCLITNTYIINSPVLTLLKDVVNEIDEAIYGNQVDTDWTLMAGGPVVRMGMEGDADITATNVLAGAYVLSETGPAGYTASDWQCDGGSLDADLSILTLVNGDEVICTISNTVIPPEVTLTKIVVGGSAEPDDFNLSVEAEPVLSGETNLFPADVLLAIDEQQVENYVDVWIFGDAKCPQVLGGTVTLTEGEELNCTIVNFFEPQPATLTLLKNVINDDGGDQQDTDWVLDAKEPVLEVHRMGVEGSASVTNSLVLPGTYTLTESGPNGYEASDWVCDGGSLTANQLTLTNDEVVTCTITNNDIRPDFTLTKMVDNTEGGAAGENDFGISVDGGDVISDFKYDYPANQPLVINEDVVTDYVFINIFGDDKCPLALGGSITLDEGEDLECVIHNKYYPPAPILTLEKEVINDDGGDQVDTDWLLIADGINNPVFRIGVEGSPMVTDSAVLPGTYKLRESGPSGYTASSWVCDGGALAGDVLTLVDEEVVTCIISNDDKPPYLAVTKQVLGGTAEPDDFALTVDGLPVLSGVSYEYLANDPMAIDEGDVNNYVLVDISGDEACPLILEGSISLDEGENAHCTITNQFQLNAPTLSLLKNVINDDGGSRINSDWLLKASGPSYRAGYGAVAVSNVLPGIYELSETGPGGYIAGDWDCTGGSLVGNLLTLVEGDTATCTITNNDISSGQLPDISVTKTAPGFQDACPAVIGEPLQFAINISNQGSQASGDIYLDDYWSWQLSLSGLPDGLDCNQPDQQTLSCNLGYLDGGATTSLNLGFTVGGNPGESICNLAEVFTAPLETVNTANNESEVCLDLAGQLGFGSGALASALVGVAYNETIQIFGGVSPYNVASVIGLPAGFTWSAEENGQISVLGCPRVPGFSQFTASVYDNLQCQESSRMFDLLVEGNPECLLASLNSLDLGDKGIPGGNSGLPDESLQKVALDSSQNRYLVGYVNNAQQNYDIRLLKLDPTGLVIWDKTYDTGSHDLGYAVKLHPDGDRIYVGGTSIMMTQNQLWWDALLLEIDADSGCAVGEHFQSAGTATSSVYYDIASDGEFVYAVGEQQINEGKPGGPYPEGGLVSIYRQQSRQSASTCGAPVSTIMINDDDSDELVLEGNTIREKNANQAVNTATVAYSVQLPEPGCENCDILVGGATGPNGWVDILDPVAVTLQSFLAPAQMSVQDMTVPGNNRIILAGSSAANDMKVLAFDRSGAPAWSQTGLGKGRLRGITSDDFGMSYAVGKNNAVTSSGLIFKFNTSGNQIDSDQVTAPGGLSFHDLAGSVPGSGIIGGQARRSDIDFSWRLFDFSCEGCSAEQ